MSRQWPWRLLMPALLATGCGGGSSGSAPIDPGDVPPLEPVERHCRIEGLPPIAGKHDGPKLLPDERHLLVTFRDAGGDQQAAVSTLSPARSGVCLAGEPRCLTCGQVSGGSKYEPFEDGRRLWFVHRSSGADDLQGLFLDAATTDIPYSVLECSPSLYDCQQSQVLPVQFPIDSLLSLPEGAQNREAQPDKHGEYVMWNEVRRSEGTRISLGRLQRRAQDYAVVEPRVIAPAYALDAGLDEWVQGSRFYENSHEFPVGNRYLAYRTTGSAMNYDVAEIDLRSGERRFVTRDIDYNELNYTSPDGALIAYSSAAGLDRMDLVSEPRRPPLLDFVAFGQVGRAYLFNNRLCMNELWLMDKARGQTADGYAGQPLVIEDDWLVRDVDWFSDSRRMLVTEYRVPNVAEPADAAQRTRFSILELPARKPSIAPVALHIGELDLDLWSMPAAAYTAMGGRLVPRQRFAGKSAGSVELHYLGNFLGGYWRVRFDNYSEDGVEFIDGTESLLITSPILASIWSVDLRVSGRRNGQLRGEVFIGPNNLFRDTLVNEIDGQRRSGIPTQAQCPGRRRPQLQAEELSRRPQGDQLELRLRISARVPEDPLPRPVWFALVRLGSVEARSDRDGEVRLRVPVGESLQALQVEAGGFASLVPDEVQPGSP